MSFGLRVWRLGFRTRGLGLRPRVGGLGLGLGFGAKGEGAEQKFFWAWGFRGLGITGFGSFGQRIWETKQAEDKQHTACLECPGD